MKKFKDNLVKLYCYISIFIIFSAIFTITYFIIFRGILEINLEFLLENPKGIPLGSEGGIRGAIIGSFLLMTISSSISMIFGTLCAIYNKIFCNSRFIHNVINFIVRSISAIPSLILGLFVYGFFIVTLDISKGLFTASLALSMMTFSFFEVSIEKAIDDIAIQNIKDSFALGINKFYMARKLIIPLIKKNIASTFVLASSYGIGATAPIILTGVVFISNTNSLFSPVMAIPFHLHSLLSQSIEIEKSYATSFVLIMILILLHVIAEIILKNIGGRLVESIRNKKS